MIVQDVMQKSPFTCTPETDLGTVARAMRDHDCGFLPVVDSHSMVVGVITDRDVATKASASRRLTGRISVKETMTRPVFSCLATENLKTALEMLAKHRIRRLPVLNKSGHLEGILSVDDVVQAPKQRGGPSAEDIVSVLKRVYARPTIVRATA